VASGLVTARTVTRYFVYGKGYNSSLVAHMQIAKRYVMRLSYNAWRDAGCPQDWPAFDAAWYAKRYPPQPNCRCTYCTNVRVCGSSGGRGCWLTKINDYRAIAREIMDGLRNDDGHPRLALPARSEEHA
jgi:hypothetical protein